MKRWSVIVLVEPERAIEEVKVSAVSETAAKPLAVRKLLSGKYKGKGCRFSVADVNELQD